MFFKAVSLFLLILIASWGASFISDYSQGFKKINGITLVAPPSPFTKNPMHAITDIGANWIALIPYAYSSLHKPDINYANHQWQWWGERPEGIRESITLAKNSHLKIMLKPQVYIHHGWVGNLDFNSEEDWRLWEANYTSFIMYFAKIAQEFNMDLFCIATEFDLAAKKREPFWRNLIKEIRKVYFGKITYSCNWDNTENIAFWDDLDFIGISAYFPLVEDPTPTVAQLRKAWIPYVQDLERLSASFKKPILFTEYGYLSVSGCAGKSWELEKNISSLEINQEAQALAFESLYHSFGNKNWWAGGFIWKWFPNGEGHEGYPEKDYTPQEKNALRVIQNWFSSQTY